MGIGKRIKEARLNLSLTQEDLAHLLGVTKGAVANYENETSHPKEPVMYKLIEVLKVDANYLFQDVVNIPKKVNDVTFAEYEHIKKYRDLDAHGKDMVDIVLDREYTRSISIKEMAANVDDKPEIVASIPYAYDLAASAGLGEYAMDIAHFETVGLSETPPRGTAFLVRVSGDSMEPKFSDGDKVYIKRQDAVNEGEIGLFYLDGNVYIKKQGYNELISLNPKYDPIPVPEYSTSKCFGRILGKCAGNIIEL